MLKNNKNLLYIILFWFFYVIFLLLIIFLAGEILTRVFNLAPKVSKNFNIYVPDKYLPYSISPYSSVNLELWTGESSHLCKHNSVGLRDREHAYNKPNNVFRILCLGDSNTYGWGVAFEESYPYLLEKKFDNRSFSSPKIEVIKAGIPAFFPELERIFLEHYGIKYQPNLVLVAFSPGDVFDTYFGSNNLRADPKGFLVMHNSSKFMKFFQLLYKQSDLFRLVARKFELLFYQVFYHWDDIYKNNGFYESSWQTVEQEFLNISNISKRIGASLVIIYTPLPSNSIKKEFQSYPAGRLENWCRLNGIFFIDLSLILEKNNMDSFYWKEGHFNTEGHKIIAETIFLNLTKQRLVP